MTEPPPPTKAALGAIAAFFMLLWLPLGQHEFLLQHWMKVGTFAAPLLLTAALVFAGENKTQSASDVRWLALLLLLAYIAHQYEEHWVDLLGNRYAFYVSVNELLLARLGALASSAYPLTPAAVFAINTTLVWMLGLLAMTYGRVLRFPTYAFAALVLVNAISHIAVALATLSYNPGVMTSVILFGPTSAITFRFLWRTELDRRGALLRDSLLWAVFAHVLMIAGVLAANYYELFPEWLYFLLLFAVSVVPLVMHRHRERE
ncbi:MAG: HXXEE domain-containing protein [Pseudomonadota bacterium]